MSSAGAERAALRLVGERLLRQATGAVGVRRLCPRCGSSDHGRPSVSVASGRAPQVSLAYADGLVAVAWSWTGPVGVDVERAGPPIDVGDGVVDRDEWTRLEAIFKAGGDEDLPVTALAGLPSGFVGTVVGREVGWRFV